MTMLFAAIGRLGPYLQTNGRIIAEWYSCMGLRPSSFSSLPLLTVGYTLNATGTSYIRRPVVMVGAVTRLLVATDLH